MGDRSLGSTENIAAVHEANENNHTFPRTPITTIANQAIRSQYFCDGQHEITITMKGTNY